MRRELGSGARLPSGVLAALVVTLVARALLPSTAYWVHGDPQRFLIRDSREYLQLATSLATDGSYSHEGRPELRRVPGFPLLVAIGVRLGNPIPATLLLHLILGLTTTWLCFASARDLADARAGTAAALLFALAPDLWIWSSYLLSETLFLLLVGGSLWLVIRYRATGRFAPLLLASTLAAAAAYVRIVGYVLPLVLALWVLVSGRRRRETRYHAVAALVAAIAVLAPWHVRNGMVSGYWGFSSQVERALFFLSGAVDEPRHDDDSYSDARRRLSLGLRGEEPAAPDDLSSIEQMRTEGWRALARRPVAFIGSYATGLLTVLIHPTAGYGARLFEAEEEPPPAKGSGLDNLLRGAWPELMERLADRSPAFWLFAAFQTAHLLACYGLGWRAWRRRSLRPRLLLAGLPLLALLLLSGGRHANGRYRAPMMPSLCIIAALGATGAGTAREGVRLHRSRTGGRE